MISDFEIKLMILAVRSSDTPDPGDQYCIGKHFYYRHDYDNAFFWFKEAADQGFGNAQLAVAEMYNNGIGTKKDLQKAFEYSKLAADRGVGPAQLTVAEMYNNGIGTKKDPQKAREYLNLAASKGWFWAPETHDMSKYFENMTGANQDYDK